MTLPITENLTQEQKQLKALVKDFFRKEVDVKRVDDIAERAGRAKTVEEIREMQPFELVARLHDIGLRQLGIPARFGGTASEKQYATTLSVAAEEAGYWGGPNGAGLLTQQWHYMEIGMSPHVTEKQKEWFFSQYMANPTWMLGATVSEPSGMTDVLLPYDVPQTVKTTAYKDGDEWVINGDKMFSSDAGAADMWKVAARTKKNVPLTEGLTFFWIKRGTPGVTQIPNHISWVSMMGNVQTLYDNVRVPESHMIGKEGGGVNVAMSVFETKWIHWAGFLGAMQRVYDHMRDYAKERVVGGRPIIQHANIAALLGEAAVDLEAYRALVYKTARIVDEYYANKCKGQPPFFWSEAVFNMWKRIGMRFCEIGTDVYGGIAGSTELPLEQYMRTVFSLRAGGASTVINAIKCSMEYNKHPVASMVDSYKE